MACHYRVAVATAQVGQPEVKIGLIPGAGGTQRLPRLAGVARAAEMCAGGNPIGAAEARDAGILDRIVAGRPARGGDPLRARGPGPRRASPQDVRPHGEAPRSGGQRRGAGDSACATVAARAPRLLAPLKAIEAVAAATTLALCRGPEERGRAVPRMPVLGPVEGADPRLLRRTGSGQGPRHPQGDADPARQAGGRCRRGDHGGRHHDGLRQCRHPGLAQGGRPGGARPRTGHHPQELRGHRPEGPADARSRWPSAWRRSSRP